MKKSARITLRLISFALILLSCSFFILSCVEKTRETTTAETVAASPQSTEVFQETEENKEVQEEKRVCAHGIDVSRWQGQIDWRKVKESGVDFAMIRIGFRDTDGLYEDPTASYNLKEAEKYGISAGVYFYSNAQNETQAIEEADWVLEHISPYRIAYPVVMDVEIGSASSLGAAERTAIAFAFLDHIRKGGYEPMLYVPLDEFEDPSLWKAEEILANYLVWIASYDAPSYPEAQFPQGQYEYAMWQYSNTGSVDGIAGAVDRNVAYFSEFL